MPSRLVPLITNVSLCKRGANPEAHQLLWKSERSGVSEPEALAEYYKADRKFTADQRKQMAASGVAMKDGSYPIPDADALGRAISSIGRGKAPSDVIKRHIIKRARALGLTSKLPKSWGVKKSGPAAGPGPSGRLGRQLATFGARGGATDPEGGNVPPNVEKVKKDDLPADLPEEVSRYIEQQDEENARLQGELDQRPAPVVPPVEGDESEVAKIRKAIDETSDEGLKEVLKSSLAIAEKAATDAKEARDESAKLRVEKADAEWTERIAKATDGIPGADPKELGPIMRKAATGQALEQAEAEKLEALFSGASEGLRQSALLDQWGSGMIGADTAYGKLEAMARSRLDGVKKSGGDTAESYTFERAFADVCADPANGALVEQYQGERKEAKR